jgi:hypothetical protein
MWKKRGSGSVLLCCDASSSDLPFPAVLRRVDGRRIGPWWFGTGGGGGGLSDDAPSEPGLSWLGAGGDARCRLLIGRACPGTAAIRLVQHDHEWTSPVGYDRFVVLGALVSDPALTAIAIDADGQPLGHEQRV